MGSPTTPHALLRFHRRHFTTPYVARFVLSPPQTTLSTSYAPCSCPGYLPVVQVDALKLTVPEIDFATRSYYALRCGGAQTPSPTCAALISHWCAAVPLPAPLPEKTEQLFDLVILPDAAVCCGWFFTSEMDASWTLAMEQHILDLWHHAPASLWQLKNEMMFEIVRPLTRYYSVIHPCLRRSSAVEWNALKSVLQFLNRRFAFQERVESLEANAAALSTSGDHGLSSGMAPVLLLLGKRNAALSPTATDALLRLIIRLYHLQAGGQGEMAERRSAACRALQKVIQLSPSAQQKWALRNTACLLHSEDAHVLLGGEDAAVPEVPHELHRVLLMVVGRRNTREAMQSWAEDFEASVQVLLNWLNEEEHETLDNFEPLKNETDMSLSMELDPEVTEKCGLTDAAYLAASLGKSLASKTSTRSWPEHLVPPFSLRGPWVPGLGTNVDGFWTNWLSCCDILCRQIDHRPKSSGQHSPLELCIKEAQRKLRICLTRRCFFMRRESDLVTCMAHMERVHHSLATPAVELTVLILSEATADHCTDISPSCHPLSYLIHLFPFLTPRVVDGITVSEFCGAASTLPEYSKSLTLSGTQRFLFSGDCATTVSMTRQASLNLCDAIAARDMALVCIANRVKGGTECVFLLDDLPSHLSDLISC